MNLSNDEVPAILFREVEYWLASGYVNVQIITKHRVLYEFTRLKGIDLDQYVD